MLSISPTTIMIRALVLFTAMPVHECAHGWMADKLGDRTARSSGRLTLNPFAHLDLFGSILLLLVGVGWAKPVPVNPYYFDKVSQKAGIAITALAGPGFEYSDGTDHHDSGKTQLDAGFVLFVYGIFDYVQH